MPRPTNKEELLKAAEEQFEKMWELIRELPENVEFIKRGKRGELLKNVEFAKEIENAGKEAHWGRDKNIRDVLIHLHEWHMLLIEWIESNMEGKERSFLPESYTWKTYGDMNIEFWKKHQNTDYDSAMVKVVCSHGKVRDIIENLSNEELFEKKHFSWTGTTNLGTYCISVTASHYLWAIKKIKMHNKLSK